MQIGAEDPGWGGSWAILQQPDFAAVMAKHLLWRVEPRGPLLVLVSRRRILGPIRAVVGGPETAGSFEAWWPSLASLGAGSLRLLTNRRVPALEGFRASADDEYSFLVELSRPEDEIFAGFESRCRRNIRSAKRAGVTARPGRVAEEFDAGWELIRATSADGRAFELPARDFVREVLDLPCGRFYVAEQDGRVVGCTVALAHGHLEAWIAGFDPGAKPLPAALLYWEIMRLARSEGLSHFDFGPQSVSGNPSLTLFKRSFSPLLRPFALYDVRRGARRFLVALQERAGR